MRPTLSVIIPTRNRAETLRRTLAGWTAHAARVAFEVVVVDDGSEDAAAGVLRAATSADPRVRVFTQSASGPASARNLAIAHAEGDLLLLAGDDIRPAPGLVDGHVQAHQEPKAPRFVLGRTEWDDERPITPVMRHITGFGGQQFRYAYLRDGDRLGFKYFYGSNLSMNRATVAAIPGPFDAAFRGAALEDADLGFRLMGRNREIEYRSALVALHDHFYDAGGFAARQRRVGLATAALAARHPEIAREFGWDAAGAAMERSPHGGSDVSMSEVEEVESLLLKGVEDADSFDPRGFDRLHAALFWYFQARGMAEARVATADLPRTLARLMRGAISCALRAALRGRGRVADTDDRKAIARAAARLAEIAGAAPLGSCLREEAAFRLRRWNYARLVGGGPGNRSAAATE